MTPHTGLAPEMEAGDEGSLSRALLGALAAREGAPALLMDAEQETRAEDLRAAALAAAERFKTEGLHRVALHMPDGPAFLAAFIGAGLAEGLPILCDPGWPQHRLEALLRPLGVQAVQGADGLHALESPAAQALSGLHVMFTSGSTGQPKAVMRSHASWIVSLARSRNLYAPQDHDAVIVPGPLSHGLGLYAAVEGLLAGVPVYSLTRFDPLVLAGQTRRTQQALMAVVPTVLRRLLSTGLAAQFTPPRTLICAGEKLDAHTLAEVRRLWPDCAVIEYYGTTETGFISLSRAGQVPPESVGRLFPGVEVGFGAGGQVRVRSELLASGYLTAAGLTPFADADGWFDTPDLGHLDRAGHLHLTGRVADLINSGGYSIAPQLVEPALREASGGLEVCVFAMSDTVRGEQVAAVIKIGGAPPDRRDLIARLRTLLPPYMVPRRFFVAEDLPSTSSGKTHRMACRDAAEAGDFRDLLP